MIFTVLYNFTLRFANGPFNSSAAVVQYIVSDSLVCLTLSSRYVFFFFHSQHAYDQYFSYIVYFIRAALHEMVLKILNIDSVNVYTI